MLEYSRFPPKSANVIKNVNRPTLVIAHNKTLAAQLCNEFREFVPENRVEYFVSYYDYYQPESYVPSTDTYIEKDLSMNDEIDKLRNSATCALMERKDVIVVASVSCIYGLGAPEEYFRLSISLRPCMEYPRDALMRKLVELQYARSDADFRRSTFRVRGDTLEIFPASASEIAIRVEYFGDEIDKIYEVEALTGNRINELSHAAIFPASQYAVGTEKLRGALSMIEEDLQGEVKAFQDEGKILEAQRLKQRTEHDLEMMREIGYCSGIENYSRYFDGRSPGEPSFTLLDYFPKGEFLVFIDESHMTIPQIRAMYHGDYSRKKNLVDYGFRMRSAYDNRPLTFEEFDARVPQLICVSATPAPYEREQAGQFAEQLIRPTGLLDPEIDVRPTKGQIDDLFAEINKEKAAGGRVLVTTLTKRMAEELTDYLKEHGVKVRYMHSDVDTLERVDIVNGLRAGEFDVLCGINLLREGLDMPEVRLVAILDADKEGFLRSDTALIQTIGRAARNADGRVIMYADTITDSMRRAIDDPERGYGQMNIIADDDALRHIARIAGGDTRAALGAVELAVLTTPADAQGSIHINLAVAEESIQKPVIRCDESLYYDMLSAFCKSLRGSDADAAMAWFARLLYAGVDPRLIARTILQVDQDGYRSS